mgnify:CR=1 FL=1
MTVLPYRQLIGRRGEDLAVRELERRGHRILARRYRTRFGEIDIVSEVDGLVVFVEVKARGDYNTAAEAIRPAQQARIRNAAAAFLARRPDLAGFDLRFDAVLVSPRRLPVHLRDAWRDST